MKYCLLLDHFQVLLSVFPSTISSHFHMLFSIIFLALLLVKEFIAKTDMIYEHSWFSTGTRMMLYTSIAYVTLNGYLKLNKKRTRTHTCSYTDTFDKELQKKKNYANEISTAIKFNKTQSINQWTKWMNRHCVDIDNHFRHDKNRNSLLLMHTHIY